MDLKSLGFTKKEIASKLLDKLTDEFWTGPDTEPDAIRYEMESRVKEACKAKIDEMFKTHVLPNVVGYVENLSMQETNRWGEPTKEKLTFKEFLVKQAEAYVTEQVDYNGRSQREERERGGYSWTGKASRISHMIHEHLYIEINTAVQAALKDLNTKVGQAIAETVKIQIAEVLAKLKVNVQS